MSVDNNTITMTTTLRHFLALILASLFISPLFAQEEPRTITADDGTSFTYRLLDNRPENFSKWSVIGGGIFMLNAKHITPKLTAFSQFQITKGLYVKGGAEYGFPISPNNVGDLENKDLRPYRKFYFTWHAVGGVRLFHDVKKKPVTIIIDEKPDGIRNGAMVSKVYYRNERVDVSRHLNLQIGVDQWQRRLPGTLPTLENISGDVDAQGNPLVYRATNIENTNIRVGLEWRTTTFNIKEINGESKPDYQDVSFYFHALIPTAAPTVNVVARGGDNFDFSYTYEPVTTGYSPLELTNFGYLIGMTAINSHDFSRRMLFGFELGQLPGPKSTKPRSNFYFGFNFGLGFGSNLRKQK